MAPWDEYGAAASGESATLAPPADEVPEQAPWEHYQQATPAPAAAAEPESERAPWDNYPDSERIDQLKQQIKEYQKTAEYQTTKAKYLDYARQAVDIPGALHELLMLPLRLVDKVWPNQPPGYTQPIPTELPAVISPEQARAAREWVGSLLPEPKVEAPVLGGKPAEEFSKGMGEGLDRLASSFTSPENLLLAVVAKQYPHAVGGLFGGQMIGSIPQAIENIQQAPGLREKGAATLELGANVALPFAIERGLRPAKVAPWLLDWRAVEPETPAGTEFPVQTSGPQPPTPPAYASQEPSPASVSQLEVRPPVGGGTPLRQQGETPSPQGQPLLERLGETLQPAAAEAPQPAAVEVPLEASSADRIIQTLDSLKVPTEGKVFNVVAGLPVYLWNGSIDAVKLAVRGGAALAEAVQSGIEWLRANHPEVIFDHREYAQAIQDRLEVSPRASIKYFTEPAPKIEGTGASGKVTLWDAAKHLSEENAEHGKLGQGTEEDLNAHATALADEAAFAFSRDRSPQNTSAKNLYENLFTTDNAEKPQNGSHRQWIRQVVSEAQRQLRGKDINLTNADFQALLWYYEKELFSKLYPQPSRSAPTDYAKAAERFIADKRGYASRSDQPGPGREGVVGPRKLSDAGPAGGAPEEPGAPEQPLLIRRLDALKQAWNNLQNLGIKPDHEASYRFYQALYDLATAYAAKGLNSAADFARAIGMPPQGLLLAAWDDAKKGNQRPPDQITEDMTAGIRQAAAKVQADQTTSEPVKGAVAQDLLYDIRQHADLDAAAQRLIAERGPDAAFQVYAERGTQLPPDLAERLKQQLLDVAKNEEAAAKAAGDTQGERAAQQRQVDLWKADAYGTSLAQGLSARQTNSRLSAGSHLRQAQEIFGDAAQKELDRVKPIFDNITEAIRRGHQEAVEDLRNDDVTNADARRAVDAAVAESGATHQAVVMELTEPWGRSPAILAHARAAIRAKANELLNIAPRPPGLTPARHLRQILDDLAQRAAGIAAAHYQGAEPALILRDKLMQRLGLSQDAATRLAKTLDAEFAKQMKAASEALPKRIAAARVRAGKGLTETASDPVVDRAIGAQLRALKLKLGALLTQHADVVDAAGRAIGDRIIADSGLTGPAAERLRETINRRFAALADAAKRRRLDALVNGPAPPPGKLVRQFDRLLKLTRLGAFDDARLRAHLAEGLGLKTLTDDIAREIVRRANEIGKMPAGELQERASVQLLNWITRQAGTKWADIPMGMFFSNALSGVTTAAIIPLENLFSLAGSALTALARGQSGPVWLGKAAARGGVRGVLHAAEIMRSGITTGVKGAVKPSNVMETLSGRAAWLNHINYWKWFGREIAALHVVTFKPAWEIKQAVLARHIARSEGLRGPAAWQRAEDLLSLKDEQVAAAKAQAAGELARLGNTSRLDFHRRVGEIIEQNRERNMPNATEIARDWALRTTYLGKPYGILGDFAEDLRHSFERLGQKYKFLGKTPRTQMPFVRIAANMFNEKINYTPWGAWRAFRAQRTGELYGRSVIDPTEIGDLYAKAFLGTAATAAMAYWFSDHIHGSGPTDAGHRRQLQKDHHWVPNSIELNGRYYSYARTPLAVPLAVIGNWKDWFRYGKGNEADGELRLAYLGKAMAESMISQSYLEQMRRTVDALADPNLGSGAAKLEKALARTAATFVVPNLANQLDRFWDPKQYDGEGILAALASQIPIVRHEAGLKPTLNALGQPVESRPFDHWSHAATTDPLWRALAAKQAWIPDLDRIVTVGSKKEGPGNYRNLTADERYEYIKRSGQAIRAELNPAEIRSLPPEEAQALVRKTVERVRKETLETFPR